MRDKVPEDGQRFSLRNIGICVFSYYTLRCNGAGCTFVQTVIGILLLFRFWCGFQFDIQGKKQSKIIIVRLVFPTDTVRSRQYSAANRYTDIWTHSKHVILWVRCLMDANTSTACTWALLVSHNHAFLPFIMFWTAWSSSGTPVVIFMEEHNLACTHQYRCIMQGVIWNVWNVWQHCWRHSVWYVGVELGGSNVIWMWIIIIIIGALSFIFDIYLPLSDHLLPTVMCWFRLFERHTCLLVTSSATA